MPEVVNSDTFHRLATYEKMQAQAIAAVLLSNSVGAYCGSPSDALTDAVSIMRAAQFAPPTGDNHHNAAVCPYCSGQQGAIASSEQRDIRAGRSSEQAVREP